MSLLLDLVLYLFVLCVCVCVFFSYLMVSFIYLVESWRTVARIHQKKKKVIIIPWGSALGHVGISVPFGTRLPE